MRRAGSFASQTLVEVPDAGEDTFLGYVSYQDIQLWIYSDRYELWDVSGTPTLLGTYYDTTKGRRNIGIRAGYDSGVWVDGTQIFNSGPALASNPVAGFGSQAWKNEAEVITPGLTLFENLCYSRGRYRTLGSEEAVPPGGTPVVRVCQFDGPRPVKVNEPFSNGTSQQCLNNVEDGTHVDAAQDGQMIELATLPNGRRTTGQIVAPDQDAVTYDEEGARDVLSPEDVMPGAKFAMHVDVVGVITLDKRTSATATIEHSWYGVATPSFSCTGAYNSSGYMIGHGGSYGATTDNPSLISMASGGAATGTDIDVIDEGQQASNGGDCTCRNGSPNYSQQSASYIDPGICFSMDLMRGNGKAPASSTQLVGADEDLKAALKKRTPSATDAQLEREVTFRNNLLKKAGEFKCQFGGPNLSQAYWEKYENYKVGAYKGGERKGMIGDAGSFLTKEEAEAWIQQHKSEFKTTELKAEPFSQPLTWRQIKDTKASEAVNALKYTTVADCLMAESIIYWQALLETLGADDFDKQFKRIAIGKIGGAITADSGDARMTLIKVESGEEVVGDSVYFRNDPRIKEMDPDSSWGGENTVKAGKDKYYGHPIGTKDEDGVRAALKAGWKAAQDASKRYNEVAERENANQRDKTKLKDLRPVYGDASEAVKEVSRFAIPGGIPSSS